MHMTKTIKTQVCFNDYGGYSFGLTRFDSGLGYFECVVSLEAGGAV